MFTIFRLYIYERGIIVFEVGDYVIYGTKGVCQVEAIGVPSIVSESSGLKYYTLHQVYTKGSRIFTPVGNQKVIMRALITEKDANRLLDDITNIETLWVPDEKKREEIYKDKLKTCDCREIIKIIKTVYCRKQLRLAEGKKMTSKDEKYLQIAENALYGELAFVFGIKKDDMVSFIKNRVETLDNRQLS